MDDEEFYTRTLDINVKVMRTLSDRQSLNQSASQLKCITEMIRERKVRPSADRLKLQKLETVVLNNLACIYRKKQKHSVALYYLRAVQNLQQKNGFPDQEVGSTYSNLCAVYSEMGRHQDAFRQITIGVSKLQNAVKANPIRLNFVNLVICYHNYAIQCEFLKKYEEAYKMIEKGLAEVEKHGLKDEGGILELLNGTLHRIQKKKDRRQQKLAKFYQTQYKHRPYFKNRSILDQTFAVTQIDNTIEVHTKLPQSTQIISFQKFFRRPKIKSHLDISYNYQTRKKSLSRQNDRPPTRMSTYTDNSKLVRTMSVFEKQQTIQNNILQYVEDRKKKIKSYRKRKLDLPS